MKAFRSDGAEEFFASWYVIAEDDARETMLGGNLFPSDGIKVLVYAGETPEEEQQARQLAERILGILGAS